MINLYKTRVGLLSHSSVTKNIDIYNFVSHSHCSRVFTTILKVQIIPFQQFLLFRTSNHSFRMLFLFLYKDSIHLFLLHHLLICSLILTPKQSIRTQLLATAQRTICEVQHVRKEDTLLLLKYQPPSITQHISSFVQLSFMIQNFSESQQYDAII